MYKKLYPEGFISHRPLPEGLIGREKGELSGRRAFFHDYCAPGYYLITATEISNSKRKECAQILNNSENRELSTSRSKSLTGKERHIRSIAAGVDKFLPLCSISLEDESKNILEVGNFNRNSEVENNISEIGNFNRNSEGWNDKQAREYRNSLKSRLIHPKLTIIGEKIEQELLSIPCFHPELEIMKHVIMPDHIHFVLRVKKRLKRKLGLVLAPFFGQCSKEYTRLINSSEHATLFDRYHDRIIFNPLQLDKAIKYVEDNPHRYLIKKLYPDLFKRYLHLYIGDREYAAYGNIFLLRHIFLLPVRVHRRWTEKEFTDYEETCRKSMEMGAVFISPAIHPFEKKIMRMAIDAGSPVIYLRDQGFKERFKPSGENFYLCSEGRLLLLAPWPDNIGRKSTAGYAEFHSMNDMAATIASLSADSRIFLKDL